MRRENNFDLLRLGLAGIVVLTHCHDLSGSSAFRPIEPLLQSGRAVEAFFAISGCLIVASWDRTRTAADYFVRRARRILPAYWLALLVCLLIGALMTTLSARAFWTSAVTWKYLFWNLLFLNYKQLFLPGVFAQNPVSPAMDGALWTIKLEVMFYLFVPLLVWGVRRFGKASALGSVFFGSILFHEVLAHAGRAELAKQLPGQLCFFVVGSAVYFYFPVFAANAKAVWLVGVAALAAALLSGSFVLDAVGVPLVTLAIAFLLPPYRGITRFGDFSYGAYVLHFPLVQTAVARGLFARAPYRAMLLVVLATALAAILSWFGVERRFLRVARVRQQESEARGQQAV